MTRGLVLLLACLASSCALGDRATVRLRPRFTTCPDGDPVRLLIDRRCPGGVCGYSCVPGRWD